MERKLLVGIVAAVVCASTVLAAELKKPQEGMSADELMKIAYVIQYTTYLEDIQLTGDFWLISKRGFSRHRKFNRSRIILERTEDDMNYKDLTVITEPRSVKGLAILSWTHLDPEREQDQWLWLPSLKKIRKVSQAAGDDAFLGSDFTTEEITTRRWEDETYTLLEPETYAGYAREDVDKKEYENTPCYKVEAKPKRDKWYYSKRIIWIEKATGSDIFQEIYDPTGRKVRTIFRKREGKPGGAIIDKWLECKNLRTGHRSIVAVKNVKLNQGLSEDKFTEKTLMRTKW